MTTIHFSWCISPTPSMIENSLYLATTARELGPCTVWVLDYEYDQVPKRLKDLVDVRPYTAFPHLKVPWNTTPKWLVEPQGDIILGCGADTIIWNPDHLLRYADICIAERAIAGTIAYLEPLPQSDWIKLFSDYEIPYEPCHRYQTTQNPVPFYLNHAAVLMPTGLFHNFAPLFYKYLVEVSLRFPDNYFMSQIALSLAIYKSGAHRIELSRQFNYSEICHPGMPDIERATIVHYENSRRDPTRCPVPALQARLKQIAEAIRVTDSYL